MNAPKGLVILVPDDGAGLIRRELCRAFHSAGCMPYALPPEALTPETAARMLTLPPERSGLPAVPGLVCSINFQGLDKYGETHALLKAKGIPVAVWCVDNPWHLISGLRDPFWQELFLFVTDKSFLPELRAHGAKQVRHLPLGTDPGIFFPDPTATSYMTTPPSAPLVFVGRSFFPDKARFFVGQRVPQALLQEALTLLDKGERPHVGWWLKSLGLTKAETRLWPGSAVRQAGLGAEETGHVWRRRCLETSLICPITVFGDNGWKNLARGDIVKSCDTRPPVDYYGPLVRIYRDAPISLNLTSFLLPEGLTQRHFDVWAAGGFCISDATPGLDLFPDELTMPIRFARAKEIPDLVSSLLADAAWMRELRNAWRAHILAEHTYSRRADTILKTVFS